MCAKCITNKLNNVEYILQNCDVPGQVGCPHPLHEAIGLGHKHSDWSAAVRTTEIPDLACTRAVAIHILILCMEGYGFVTSIHPVKHGQVHPHLEGGRGEMNQLREVGEQLVIEALHPVSVAALL